MDCDRCGKRRPLVRHPFLREGKAPFLYCVPCMRRAVQARRAMNHRPPTADELALTNALERAAAAEPYDPRQLVMEGA